jgi:D-hexose-6-phosphate mutarotase
MKQDSAAIPDIEQLNREFSFDEKGQSVRFETGEGGLPVIEVQNGYATARISLQGAYVLSWIPAGQAEVIWVSEAAIFAPGKSVRGGIPICWPWFGVHETRDDFPAHGFARTVFWQVRNTRPLESGGTEVTLSLDTTRLDQQRQRMWPYPTTVEYRVTVAQTLGLELTTCNHGEQSFIISEALHTYFKMQDIAQVTVRGLEGKDYLDKTDAFKRKTQSGPITITHETDRVYVDTSDQVVIENSQREVVIDKQGSLSTVVWNPWQATAKRMGDLGKEGYRNMLCVETANAADNSVSINPGECHRLALQYRITNTG